MNARSRRTPPVIVVAFAWFALCVGVALFANLLAPQDYQARTCARASRRPRCSAASGTTPSAPTSLAATC